MWGWMVNLELRPSGTPVVVGAFTSIDMSESKQQTVTAAAASVCEQAAMGRQEAERCQQKVSPGKEVSPRATGG